MFWNPELWPDKMNQEEFLPVLLQKWSCGDRACAAVLFGEGSGLFSADTAAAVGVHRDECELNYHLARLYSIDVSPFMHCTYNLF